MMLHCFCVFKELFFFNIYNETVNFVGLSHLLNSYPPLSPSPDKSCLASQTLLSLGFSGLDFIHESFVLLSSGLELAIFLSGTLLVMCAAAAAAEKRQVLGVFQARH